MNESLREKHYLACPEVAGFIDWMRPYMQGKKQVMATIRSGMTSKYTLYQALGSYSWRRKNFKATMKCFDAWQKKFKAVGVIKDSQARDSFVSNARCIVSWGGTGRLGILNNWSGMEPRELHDTITELKLKLDPGNADLYDLRAFNCPRSGFSKICSVLVPGLPIYDSRVACALACLVRKYYQDKEPSDILRFHIPPWKARKPERCIEPGMHSATAYAQDVAWLLNAILENPEDFSRVAPAHQLYALQFALFVIGYSKLT